MIKAEGNHIKIHGNTLAVLAEITLILRAAGNMLTESYGKSASDELMQRVVENATSSEEEIEERTRRSLEELLKRAWMMK